MSISILLPAQPSDLLRLKDVDKFLLRAKNVKQRSIVFFDESVSVFVILKHDNSPKTVFMDVSVMPGQPPTDHKPEVDLPILSKEAAVIASFSLANTSVILEGKSEIEDAFYSIWTYQVPIVYPKKKVDNPQILISCSCRDFIMPSVETAQKPKEVEILPDLEPKNSTNLLAELNNPVLKNKLTETYNLPSSLIEPSESRRSPLPVPEKSFHSDTLFQTSISVPVSVSLVIRLKSTKPAGRNNVLLATLNVESSEELGVLLSSEDTQSYYFSILSLDVSFKYGSMVELTASDYKMPMRIRLADALNLTYKLVNADFEREPLDPQVNSSSKALNIKLVLQVQRYDCSANSFVNVSNEITTFWAPILDFTIMAPPINSSLRTSVGYSQVQSVGGRGLQRKSALHSVYSIKSNSNSSQLVNGTNINPPAVQPGLKQSPLCSSNVTVNLANNPASALSGLKLTFIGSFTLKLGEVSSWKIQAINNSSSALNLSIVVQDPLHWAANAAQRGPVSNTSSSNVLGQKSGNDVLVVNKIHLLNEIATMKPRSGGVVFLENDIRLGPLETNNVMETSIQLMGIARGIHNLEGIKVFDTNTGDGLDFGKLVQVFVT